MDLLNWLRNTGSLIGPEREHGHLTHVLLTGGRVCVREGQCCSSFLEKYADGVIAGRKQYLVERTLRGGSYRMFADLDVISSDEGNAENLLQSVLKIALGSLPDQLQGLGAIVCCRKWAAGKIGAHIVWGDDARVDDVTALAIRDSWVKNIGLATGCTESLVEMDRWNAIIDSAVYASNGLRMPWSLKRDGCILNVYVPAFTLGWSRLVDPTTQAQAHAQATTRFFLLVVQVHSSRHLIHPYSSSSRHQ